ncbi:hypothetical protein FHG87_012083 [Trinorchestia longiramus]|nr:hypothetical protein FHG87_012083 [Trinorchestia longiramus]
MFAKVRTSHLQHKEDSMLATVKGSNENRCKLIDFSKGNEFENLNVTIGDVLHAWDSKEWKAAFGNVLVNYEARRLREALVDCASFSIHLRQQRCHYRHMMSSSGTSILQPSEAVTLTI